MSEEQKDETDQRQPIARASSGENAEEKVENNVEGDRKPRKTPFGPGNAFSVACPVSSNAAWPMPPSIIEARVSFTSTEHHSTPSVPIEEMNLSQRPRMLTGHHGST